MAADQTVAEDAPQAEPTGERREAESRRTVELVNDVMRLEITNEGGAIAAFVLEGYEGDDGERDMGQAAIVAAEAIDLPIRVGIAGNKLAARIADCLAELVVGGLVDPGPQGLDKRQIGRGGFELVTASLQHGPTGDVGVVDQLTGEAGLA